METQPSSPARSPQETDLLVPFEIQNFPSEYRQYYAMKRNNLFASIQGVPDLWNCYHVLDQIWFREFEDLKTSPAPRRMFPLLLYFNAHAKMRVALELAFSGCLGEARSILRDAIEFVAHAHAMCTDSALQKVWLEKNDGKAALEAFKNAFERHKTTGLFNGLPELQKSWSELSETGSHASPSAIADRFVHMSTDQHIEFRLKYTGADPEFWEMSLFSMLLTCSTMENTLFSDYDDRLKLDNQLMQARGNFDRRKELLREQVKSKFNLTPPGGVHQPKPTIFRP
jgi:hypothetical protein